MRHSLFLWLVLLASVASYGQIATPTQFGVIKIGTGLASTDGVVSVTAVGGGGSSSLAQTIVTNSYTASGSDQVLAVNSGATSITLTLPSASGVTGKPYYVKRYGDNLTGSLTMASASPIQAIGGSFTTVVGQAGTTANQNITSATWLVPASWGSLTYYSDGTSWRLLDYHSTNLEFNQNKITVLVMGSSSANGAGAAIGSGGSATAPLDRNGWIQQIATSLASTHRFIFVTVDGAGASDLLATADGYFQRWQPKYVVYGLTLGNKWASQANVPLGHDEFVDEYRQLIELAKNNGVIPLITTPHVRSDFNTQKDNFYQSAHRQLSNLEGAFILANGEFTHNGTAGAYYGNAGDGIHFNMPTHTHMGLQIPRFYFTSKPRSVPNVLPAGNGTRITGASTVRPIELDYNYQSFCLTFDIKRESGAGASKIIASFQTSSNSNFRVELDGSYMPRLMMGTSTVLATSATAIGTDWQKLTVRYNALQNKVSIYQNGTKTGESSSVGANWPIAKLVLGGTATSTTGNAIDYSYRNVQVQTTAPHDATIQAMHRGMVYKGNLINLSYFSEEQSLFTGLRFTNETDFSPRWITNQ